DLGRFLEFRRGPRRRRHHERDACVAVGHRGPGLDRRDLRVRRRRRRRELRPVEQRGHRALGSLRAELHAGPPRRQRRPGEGSGHQRAVPGLPPVLVAPGARRCDRLAQDLHHLGAAHQLRQRRRGPHVHAQPVRGAGPPAAVRRSGVLRRPGRAHRLGALGDGRPQQPGAGGRHPLTGRHRRELRRADPVDARRRGPPPGGAAAPAAPSAQGAPGSRRALGHHRPRPGHPQ
ncbi:MAG: Malate:quinone oxidoreductase, partial [uncultured Solirubrobacteraceae bacterium]